MAEWFKAHAWKACVAKHYREFESLSLRHFFLPETGFTNRAIAESLGRRWIILYPLLCL